MFFLFAFIIFQLEYNTVFGKETERIADNTPYQTITLKHSEVKVIYFYINLKGNGFYKILNKSGTNKINCW